MNSLIWGRVKRCLNICRRVSLLELNLSELNKQIVNLNNKLNGLDVKIEDAVEQSNLITDKLQLKDDILQTEIKDAVEQSKLITDKLQLKDDILQTEIKDTVEQLGLLTNKFQSEFDKLLTKDGLLQSEINRCQVEGKEVVTIMTGLMSLLKRKESQHFCGMNRIVVGKRGE